MGMSEYSLVIEFSSPTSVSLLPLKVYIPGFSFHVKATLTKSYISRVKISNFRVSR